LEQGDLPRRVPLERGEPRDERALLVEELDRRAQVLLGERSTGDPFALLKETAVLRDKERDRGGGGEVLGEMEHVRRAVGKDPGEDPVQVAAHVADVRKDERIDRV